MRTTTLLSLAISAGLTAYHGAHAQAPSGPRPPEFISPEVSAEKKITFRVHAPKAEKVMFSSSDLPGVGRGIDMKKADDGVWEATAGPVASGSTATISTSTVSR